MQFPRALALILLLAPLAGCAQLDTAKEKVDEAQEQIAAAKREVDEARDRLDRVRSLTAVRQETLDLVLTPTFDETARTVRFDVNATRGGVEIPRANLTSLAPIAVRAGEPLEDGAWILCDPLNCAILMETGGQFEARPAPDAAAGVVARPDARECTTFAGPEAAPGQLECAFRVASTRGWVTTAMGDATS